MPFRPTKEERENKLKRRLEVMPEVYEKVGIPTISEKSEKIMSATDILEKVYTILDNEDIVGQDRIKYLNFARIIWRLNNRYTGAALINQAERELRAYLERKKDVREDILRKIKDAIIGVKTTATTPSKAPAGT